MQKKTNQSHIKAIIKKPVIGNSFIQFKFTLITAIFLGFISIGLMGISVCFKLSDNLFWIAIAIGVCSIFFMLILRKKITRFEIETAEKYTKILSENIS